LRKTAAFHGPAAHDDPVLLCDVLPVACLRESGQRADRDACSERNNAQGSHCAFGPSAPTVVRPRKTVVRRTRLCSAEVYCHSEVYDSR
jgi:hypothetical protein